MNMPVSMYRRWYFERNESFVVPNQFPPRAEVVAEAVGAVPQEVAAVALPQEVAAVALEEEAVPQEVAAVALAVEAVPQEVADEAAILSFDQYTGSHRRSVDEQMVLLDEYFNYLSSFQSASPVVAEPVATLENENFVVPNRFPRRAEVVAEAVEAVPQEVADEAVMLSFDQYIGSHRRSVDEQMVLLDEYFNYLSSFQSASSVVAEPAATLESYEHVSEDNGGGTPVELGPAVAGSGSLFEYSEASRVADAHSPRTEHNSANDNFVVPNRFPQSAEVVAEAVEAVPQEVARVARDVEAVPQEVADEAVMLSFDQYTGSHRRSIDEQMVLLDEYFNYLSSFQSASSVVAEPVATLESYEHVSGDNGGGGTPLEPGAAMAGSGSLFKYSEASHVADAHSPPTEHNSAIDFHPRLFFVEPIIENKLVCSFFIWFGLLGPPYIAFRAT